MRAGRPTGLPLAESRCVLSGELYDPLDPQLSAERRRARLLCKALNDTTDEQQDERARLIKELLPAAARRAGLESGKAVEIGDDVWIGGGAIICPGVRIGARSVIGAGSVVTRHIPDGVFAAGNPCRLVREIGQ